MTGNVEVDVVIPVYRDLQATRRCVTAVLRHTDPALARRIVLVDDASPEPELSAWCDELAQDHRVQLLRNETNQGFVASVNRAMALDGGRDVVLLNSDTEVPAGWLERLVDCAYRADDVATVTPFSNNATICSYPYFCQSAELPEGLDLATLDDLFARANPGLSCELPTAVGFCVYIRRACLDQIGLFDAERYGRGYGEENDFSLRADAAGWRNLLCADLFVYHQGAVSFGDDRFALMEQGGRLLAERYPGYNECIADFIVDDPLREFRDRVDALRAELPGQASVLVKELHRTRDRVMQAEALGHRVDAQVRRLVTQYQERIKAYDHRCDEYERLLSEAREGYAQVDQALAEAQHLVAEYERNRQRMQVELQEVTGRLERITHNRHWRWVRRLLE